jgi:hypothetical protein
MTLTSQLLLNCSSCDCRYLAFGRPTVKGQKSMRTSVPLLIVGVGLLFGGANAQDAPVQDAPPQDLPPLGGYHIVVELDAMYMQHQTFETDEAGLYIGLAGYGHLGNSWYLGGEIGAGTAVTFFSSNDSSYMPLELNAKRGFPLAPWCAVELGGGLSFSRISFSHDSWINDEDEVEISDWVFGGQLLGSLTFKAGPMILGLKLKYQLTTDAEEVAELISPDEGWDYSNFKIGLQVGFMGSR